MRNTIELLETIGRDASLRHASGDDLSRALSDLNASEALKQAAITGDHDHLAMELGHREMLGPNHVNNGVGGGQDEEGEHEDGVDIEHDGDDAEGPVKSA